jgi:hypothetical protein
MAVTTAVYDDPEFSQLFRLAIGAQSQQQAMLAVTALAWNTEYADHQHPLSKYTVSDPHVINMAAL